jgi:hypothetical protein
MASLFALILIAGLFVFLLWHLFYRSLLWVAEPFIKHFENREAERFMVEDFEEESLEDIDLDQIPKNKVKVSLKDFDKPIHLPKSLLEKAKKEPQKLANTNLWIYKEYIFPSQPTEEKLREVFGQNT